MSQVPPADCNGSIKATQGVVFCLREGARRRAKNPRHLLGITSLESINQNCVAQDVGSITLRQIHAEEEVKFVVSQIGLNANRLRHGHEVFRCRIRQSSACYSIPSRVQKSLNPHLGSCLRPGVFGTYTNHPRFARQCPHPHGSHTTARIQIKRVIPYDPSWPI